MVTTVAKNIRIPNLPNGQIVDDNGNPTDDEITFRHALISQLQDNFGNEGCIVPTQTNAAAPLDFIHQIQNNRIPNPITGAADQYTCGFGRFLYDATNNRILVSIDGGGGVPAFMEVTLTVPVPPV
jgi:hypothetical protein